MIVFCGGMIRSGSTLQFQIAYQILAPRKLCRRWTYLVPERLEKKLRRLDSSCANGLAKTHVLTPSAIHLLQHGRAKALYCFRDLRDVAVSGMRAFGYDWARFKSDRLLEDAVAAEEIWRAQPGLLVQRYEQFITDLPAAVTEIAQHLKIELKPREAIRIARKLSLDRQKEKLKRWKAAFFTSATHIDRGEIGAWRNKLDPSVANEITTKYSEWLTAHGYPLIGLPEEPETSDEFCYVPHIGWMTFERGDAVLTGLREGDFEFAEQAFFHRVLRAGDIIIDCGAHSGLYTRLAAPLVSPGGCIHAIEPTPQTFTRLQHNTANLPLGIFQLHQLALGAANAKIGFVTMEHGRSAYNHVAGPAETGGAIIVRQITMPAFWKLNGLREVDFVKIDAEGQELAILKAAAPLLRRGAIRALMIEFSRENLARYGTSRDALWALLTTYDYNLFMLDRNQFQLVSANLSDLEGYTNIFAVKNVNWLQQRFAGASLIARKIAGEIVLRGAQVSIHRRRLLENINEQHSFIGTLRKEKASLEESRQETLQASNRNSEELQKHIDSLIQNLDQLAATSRQQTEYIGILEKERNPQLESATICGQSGNAVLRSQLDELAATTREQTEYIGILEKERDRIAAEAQQARGDIAELCSMSERDLAALRSQLEHLATISREQTEYIDILEEERGRLAGEAQQAHNDFDRLRNEPQCDIGELRAQIDQLAATSREQAEYIATLQKERDRRAAEGNAAQEEVKRVKQDGQEHIVTLKKQLVQAADANQQSIIILRAQLDQLAATSREQAEYIATLQKERDRLTAEGNAAQEEVKRVNQDGQEHIDALRKQLVQAADANQQSIIVLRAQLDQLAATSHEQAGYIATLQKERDRLTGGAQQVRQNLERLVNDSQREVDDVRSQLGQLAATTRQQTEYIGVMERERNRLAGEAQLVRKELDRLLSESQSDIASLRSQLDRSVTNSQTSIDALRSKLDQLAATSRQQAGYITTLEKERDRLDAGAAKLTAECTHYVDTINQQTAYIRLLELERKSSTTDPGT